jgi:hypothetical protein
MAAQQGKLAQPDIKKMPTLSKEETLKHLQTTAKVQMEQMKSMENNMPTMDGVTS